MGLKVGSYDSAEDRYFVLEPNKNCWGFNGAWSCSPSLLEAVASAERLGRPCLILKAIGEYIPPPPQPVTGFRAYKD